MASRNVWVIRLKQPIPMSSNFWKIKYTKSRISQGQYLNINGHFRGFNSTTWLFFTKKQATEYVIDMLITEYVELIKCVVVPAKS